MQRPIVVRPLSDEEVSAVAAGLRSSDAFTLRRSQIVRASVGGARVRQIAAAVGCTEQAVRNVLHAFNARGVAVLVRRSCAPKTVPHTVMDAAATAKLQALVHRSPRDFGHATSLWTLDLLAAVSAAEGITARQVSGETIRTALARLGVRWRRAKQWISSPDAAYAQKNAGVTA